MKAWEIVSEGGIDALELNERPLPDPGHGQVRVKVAAWSINYRDLSTVMAPAARNLPYPTVPNSDCAGEVVALGPGVTRVAEGDRVMGCFFQDWESGGITPKAMASALGGAVDGVLAETVVLNENAVVPVPSHLSLEEASTLPCAAVTAWHALTAPQPVRPGETVLLLGTGGVSVFAQQFANLFGARTIATSSSDHKLERMRALGAADAINYRSTPDWDEAVLDLTDGVGADRVIEVGGPGTLQKSISVTRVGGNIALIGILTGAGGEIMPTDIMRKSLMVKGVYVGSRVQFEDMARALAKNQLRPVIDEIYDFEEAKAAFHRMHDATHFGKLVVRR